ncbi:MAG: hypothetical protein L0Y79_12175 [Chlorobi bacterium]|nr:hypothetical protein [Chlorobiota bacterium]MCI0715665.1 hypothetical protein [Chlorobiota bacterium]
MANFIIAVILILFAVFSRLIPHPMNFAPITAIALFSGAYLNKKYAFIIPLIALVISDTFIGFYSYIYWVYGTFLLIALIGLWLKSRVENSNGFKKAGYIFGTAFVSSVIFFLVTNFGVWTSGMFYEMNFSGLIQSYTMAIPFFRNSLAGDLFYVTAMFGIYEIVKKYTEAITLEKSKARK